MPKQDYLTERLARLSPAKRALFEREMAKRSQPARDGVAIPRRPQQSHAPLSFAQQRLWFLSQLEPDSLVFLEPKAFRLKGPVQIPALRNALTEIARRHETLRTTFVLADGNAEQRIAENSDVNVPIVDLSAYCGTERETEAQMRLNRMVHRQFDLSRDRMLQASLLRLDECDHILLLLTHHIVSDGWSLGILSRELGILYDCFASGRPSPLPELPIQYADYALWQRDWLGSDELERQLRYWRKQLRAASMLELPADALRPAEQTFASAQYSFALPAELSARMMEFNRAQNVTPFMTLLAAFQVLLSRHSGQDEVVLGIPVANRHRVELESLIGLLLNTLVLRGDLSGEPSFTEVVRRVRQTTLDAHQHQDVPFEKLVEDLKPERDLSRHPLFQVMFTLQNAPTNSLCLTGLEVSPYPVSTNASALDLEAQLWREGDTYRALFLYNTALFSADRMERMAGHYQMLLDSMLADPGRPVSEVPMLTAGERHQVVVGWNQTTIEGWDNECIHHLVERQVERTPDAVAVVFQDRSLTYRELNERANVLAHSLRTLGAIPGTRIGVCLEPSLELVIGLLGILKSGAAYVPLDHHFPPGRLALIWQEAEVRILLVHSTLKSVCGSFTGETIVLNDVPLTGNAKNPDVAVTPNDVAYVIYTSGSTGRPKGVVIQHGGVANVLKSTHDIFGIKAEDTLLTVTTISFDISVLELFLPLIAGAHVVIAPDDIRGDGEELAKLLERSNATVLQATPTTWNLLLAFPWRARKLKALAGGEALPTELAARILNRCAELWNLYGPTEATIWSTIARIERSEEITIGRPIANTQVHVVDRHLQPVPVGVPGELLIGGAGIARGYLGRPELTAERFVADPFSTAPARRLYRTGDLCRYRPDGSMEFLGRVDQQVKIRGFRVELGEIEAAVKEHPAVDQCIAIDRLDQVGDRRLVAYVTPNGLHSLPPAAGFREFLKTKLPDYMLPSIFVRLDEWPLTSAGKIDRKALPEPAIQRIDVPNKASPRNAVERQIARIWEDLLHIRGIGMTDDFFELGGHSLLAVRLIAEVNKAFDIHLPLATIFRTPTIQGLAGTIGNIDELTLKAPGLIEPRDDEAGLRIFWAPSIGSLERFVECHHLARFLRDEYRFYGFDPAPEITDITTLARHCVKLIRERQPHGPYLLAGYCQCGHVAYEIATHLERDGEEVQLLAIIDCSARDLAAGLRQRLYWIRDGFRRDPRLLLRQMGSFVKRKFSPASHVIGQNGQSKDPFAAHHHAVRFHKVRRFPGTVDLFRSREWLSRLPHSPKLGWDALARKVRVHPVSSRHTAMLSDPAGVEIVVGRLKEFLRCRAK